MHIRKIRESSNKHAEILLFFHATKAHDSVATLALKWLGKAFFDWVQNDSLVNPVRKISRSVFGLANKHVSMTIQKLPKPVSLFPAADASRIIAFGNNNAIRKASTCNNRLHVNKILKRYDACIRIIFRNTTQPSYATHF